MTLTALITLWFVVQETEPTPTSAAIQRAVTRCGRHRVRLLQSRSVQSCHFALFVNPVAHASTDLFFTFCGVHVEHERDSQATCLLRRHG